MITPTTKLRGQASVGLLAAIFAPLAAPLTHFAQLEEPAWCRPDCRDIVSDWRLTAYAVIRAACDYTNGSGLQRGVAA
jgi:hypothetical protein